jgi:hypothetical protein
MDRRTCRNDAAANRTGSTPWSICCHIMGLIFALNWQLHDRQCVERPRDRPRRAVVFAKPGWAALRSNPSAGVVSSPSLQFANEDQGGQL